MKALHLACLAAAALAVPVIACGGISDPNKKEAVATVSGKLTGTTLPSGARVALVWRNGSSGGVAVGADVPIVDGAFSMTLSVPPAGYFFQADATEYAEPLVGSGGSTPPSAGSTEPAPAPVGTSTPSPAPTGTSGMGARSLHPTDTASGTISPPLAAAIGGFVVYVDTNGNGQLDLAGQYASTQDQVLGGNKEIMLAYLKGGGQLDYEKLRDKSGILPTAGFNLAWEKGRWLPLNLVELKIADSQAKLPSTVCSSGSGGVATATADAPSSEPSGSSGGSNGSGTSGSTGTGGSYPSSTDPGLHCAPDGRSFTYEDTTPCPPPPPTPTGLCADGLDIAFPGCARAGYGTSLQPGQPVPAGWPCPIPEALDGGAAPDGN